jgi:hypothetical protein
MLILFAVFVDHAQKAPPGALQQADNAMAAFSFFLFLVYAAFTIMLGTFRGDVIKEESALASDEYAARDVPPENI